MVKKLFLDAEFLKDKKTAVAVSGGRDSMALLDLFEKSGTAFFAVNVEHGIRGAESVRDSDFVADYCKNHNIKLKTFKVDALFFARENRMTTEQAARELRYSAFGGLLKNGDCDLVALAHHADDQAETVLMRIFRGTGLKGLKGMEICSRGYFRPLLQFSREDINAYIAENAIPYVDDSTNEDADANRNFLRNEVLPLVKQRYPSCRDTLLRLSRNAREADDFISGFVRPFASLSENSVEIALPFPHPAVFKREVMLAANTLGVFQDIEECHFDALYNLSAADTSKKISLAHGIYAVKSPNGIFIVKDENLDRGFETPFKTFFESGTLDICGTRYCLCDCDGRVKAGEIMFDADKIPQNAVLRFRRENDSFTKFGGGTKSLGDFFTDRKIPVFLRDRALVCAAGSDVLFVAGVEISDKIKVDKTTKNIFKLTQETL